MKKSNKNKKKQPEQQKYRTVAIMCFILYIFAACTSFYQTHRMAEEHNNLVAQCELTNSVINFSNTCSGMLHNCALIQTNKLEPLICPERINGWD